MNSSYKNFRAWLCEKYPCVIGKEEELYGYCNEEWWSDFEYKLALYRRIAFENQPDLVLSIEIYYCLVKN